MSKERELLRRVRDTLHALKETPYDLYWDIQTALDQPEQEPVAWMYEWYEGDTESTSTYCGSEKPFQEDEVKPFNLRPLYEHPKRNELTPRQGLAEYKKGYARAELDLKREPFGPEERQRLSKAYSTRVEQVAFEEGIIFAEISYGIGGE